MDLDDNEHEGLHGVASTATLTSVSSAKSISSTGLSPCRDRKVTLAIVPPDPRLYIVLFCRHLYCCAHKDFNSNVLQGSYPFFSKKGF